MFITDQFVFLHIPKTGGTFVHKVLRELVCPNRTFRRLHSVQREYGLKIPLLPYKYKEVRKHTIRRCIPEATDGSRAVMLAVRNPLDHCVSHFRFGWWRNFADRWFRDASLVESQYGNLADFDFPTFVESTLQHANWTEHDPPAGRRPLGPRSAEWLRYFCHSPDQALQQNSDGGLVAEVRQQMSDLTTLHMESLNRDLKNFLIETGTPSEQVSFLDAAPKVYPGKQTRQSNDPWQSYYTTDLYATMEQHEWLLFELFPQYRPEPGLDTVGSQQT